MIRLIYDARPAREAGAGGGGMERTNVDADVIIVGAGLAGLACARRIAAAGLDPIVLEAADVPGGRVRTERVGGFLLDHGFQVLPTAYPEARAVLDYAALDLKAFAPEAWVRHAGRFRRISDPWRRPMRLPAALLSPLATLGDKYRFALLRRRVLRTMRRRRTGGVADPEITTLAALRAAGLSDVILDRLCRPLFGGVLLDRDLAVSSRAFESAFAALAAGDVAVPAAGMGAIPRQMAAALPPGTVRPGTEVAAVQPGSVTLAGGASHAARAVVVATAAPAAARLLGDEYDRPSRGVTCLHFAADRPPFTEPFVVLDAAGEGPVHHLAVMSNVAPSYAPSGAALITATVIGMPDPGGPALEPAARDQMETWFGRPAQGWRLLRIERIPHAAPAQVPPALDPLERSVRAGPGVYVCGDHRDHASIDGALVSGRRAAEAVLTDLLGGREPE
jgi:phytoene dehydrogenase-like protein